MAFTLLLDGGVRNGQDVVKALALGAKATLIGRPWVYAVAARGEDGVQALLGTFKNGMDVSMALTGVPNISDLSPDILT